MATVYMFRHQKAGIITSHVFASKPTPEQLAPLQAECERLHGKGWGIVHEAEFVEGAAVPSVAAPAPAAAGAMRVEIGGAGTVAAPAPAPAPDAK